MECSVQFRLRNNTLIQLYREFGTAYRTRYSQAVTSAIQLKLQDSTAGVAVDDFYARRDYINSLAFEAAAGALNPRGADVVGLQIRRVTLPADTERAIVTKLVSLQAQETAENVKQQLLINSQTAVLVQTVQQQIDLFVNNQTQTASVVTNTAAARAKSIELTAASSAYTVFGSTLAFSNGDLLKYLQLKNVLTLPVNSTVLAQFDALSAFVQ